MKNLKPQFNLEVEELEVCDVLGAEGAGIITGVVITAGVGIYVGAAT